MSNARYIELDSTFRDRKLWPEPSEFECPIAQCGVSNEARTAINTVSFATPLVTWTSNLFDAATPGSSVLSGTVDTASTGGINAWTNNQAVLISIPNPSAPQEAPDYYAFAPIHQTVSNERTTVLTSTYMGLIGGIHKLLVTLTSPILTLATGDPISIIDPTEVSISMIDPLLGPVNFANPRYFIPHGPDLDNAYTKHVLYNETRSESRPVAGYSALTHTVSLITNGSTVATAESGPVTLWLPTENYSIRRVPPRTVFTQVANPNPSQVVLQGGLAPPGPAGDGFYNGEYIRVRAGSDRYVTTLYPTPASGTPTINEIRRVISYEGLTNLATVTPPFSTVPPTDPALPDAQQIELLQFTVDSFRPFRYSGSIVSQQDLVCYEIELLNLVLPNLTLAVQGGGRTAFKQYLYVELSNVSTAGGTTPYSIYSNNPSSTRMVFRAAIDDVPNPLISGFIKIDGDGMVQTLKFKPNDNLRMSVRMQDGEPYRVTRPDRPPPFEPDPSVQISALFSIRRL